MSLTDFLRILAQAVKYSQRTANKHEQLQTFAWLRFMYDFNTENLEKNINYKNKDYFYSRKWELSGHPASNVTFEYPGLFIFILGGTDKSPFGKSDDECHRIQFNVLYPNYDKVDQYDTINCTRLVPEDIYPLTKKLLRSVLHFIKGVVLASVDGADKWENKELLEAMQAAGVITSFTINEAATKKFHAMMQRNNESANTGMVDDESNDVLCGSSMIITFCEKNCDDIEHTFDFSNCCGGL